MGQILEPYQDTPAPQEPRHDPREPAARAPGTPAGCATRPTRWPRSRAPATPTRRRPRSTSSSTPTPASTRATSATSPYRISTVRYYGDGEEEADYSGSPTRNIEIDGWGLYLWAARQYVDASSDTGWLDETTKKGDTVYDAIKTASPSRSRRTSRPTGMAIADASIWEVHWGNRQHFLYTTATAARGFCDMATLARRAGHIDDVERYQRPRDEGARRRSPPPSSTRNNVLAGSLERLAQGTNYRDGATVEAVTFGRARSPTTRSRRRRSARCRTCRRPAGGYKRVEGSQDQYDTDEWILIDLRASRCVPPRRQPDKADQLLALGHGAGVGELQPAARALQHAVVRAAQIGAYSGCDPDGRLRRRRLPDHAARSRGHLRALATAASYDPGEYPDAGTGGGGGGGAGDRRAAPAWRARARAVPGAGGNARDVRGSPGCVVAAQAPAQEPRRDRAAPHRQAVPRRPRAARRLARRSSRARCSAWSARTAPASRR